MGANNSINNTISLLFTMLNGQKRKTGDKSASITCWNVFRFSTWLTWNHFLFDGWKSIFFYTYTGVSQTNNTQKCYVGNSMICSVVIFGINTTSDISKFLYVISRAVRPVKFETILKYHEWYLCQISHKNHAIICLYYYPQGFTRRNFKISWNTTALSQSNAEISHVVV